MLVGTSRPGDNLWTASIVAVNVDTGKLAWYYQATPHETHDWDAAQTPVIIDGVIDGKPRSWWPRPTATATTSCSTARTASTS